MPLKRWNHGLGYWSLTQVAYLLHRSQESHAAARQVMVLEVLLAVTALAVASQVAASQVVAAIPGLSVLFRLMSYRPLVD